MEVRDLGLPYYVDRISNNEPFSFVRYGDGEWSAAILHNRARTGTGSHSLTIPQMVRDLQRSLTSIYQVDSYFVATRPNAVAQNPLIERWLLVNTPKGTQWNECRIFCQASMRATLNPFITALRNLEIPLVFVGPDWLRGLKDVAFPKALFIEVPHLDCYHAKAALNLQVRKMPKPALISFSAGPAAKILIHELFPLLGNRSFMLDLGSLWDVYVGRYTRGYHRHRMNAEIIETNLRWS